MSRARLVIAGVVAAAACGNGGAGAPVDAPAATGAVASMTAATGDQLYGRYCAACHGAGGTGTPVAPRPLRDTAYLAATPDSVLRGRIARGVPGTAMAPWSGMLSPEQLDALVATIRGFAPVAGAAVASPADSTAAAAAPSG